MNFRLLDAVLLYEAFPVLSIVLGDPGGEEMKHYTQTLTGTAALWAIPATATAVLFVAVTALNRNGWCSRAGPTPSTSLTAKSGRCQPIVSLIYLVLRLLQRASRMACTLAAALAGSLVRKKASIFPALPPCTRPPPYPYFFSIRPHPCSIVGHRVCSAACKTRLPSRVYFHALCPLCETCIST